MVKYIVSDNELLVSHHFAYEREGSIRLEHERAPPKEEPEEFLPSDDEEEENTTPRSYVPPHMPKFPSKHSFQRTPVSRIIRKDA